MHPWQWSEIVSMSCQERGAGAGWVPMWGKVPTTEITFKDGNRCNNCTYAFNSIDTPRAAVADGENIS